MGKENMHYISKLIYLDLHEFVKSDNLIDEDINLGSIYSEKYKILRFVNADDKKSFNLYFNDYECFADISYSKNKSILVAQALGKIKRTGHKEILVGGMFIDMTKKWQSFMLTKNGQKYKESLQSKLLEKDVSIDVEKYITKLPKTNISLKQNNKIFKSVYNKSFNHNKTKVYYNTVISIEKNNDKTMDNFLEKVK